VTTLKYPSPVKIDLPEQPDRKSNAIYKWFQHQQGIENLEHKITVLEAQLKAYKEALKERQELLKEVKAEVKDD
jgi:chromosome segregation ATPase